MRSSAFRFGLSLAVSSIALAAALKKPIKISEYWQHDLTYRVELPWDTTATLTVQNIFDDRISVTSSDGATPVNYQRDYLDPQGRVFRINLRKILF